MDIKTILAEMIAARALLRRGVEEAGHALAKLDALTEALREADGMVGLMREARDEVSTETWSSAAPESWR